MDRAVTASVRRDRLLLFSIEFSQSRGTGLEDRYTINPYEPTYGRDRDAERSDNAALHTFRWGLVPATVLFFVAAIAVLYGAMVVPNVLRDARNGYDARYLLVSSFFPGLLFGFGLSCVLAGRQFMQSKWKNGLKTAGIILRFGMAVIG